MLKNQFSAEYERYIGNIPKMPKPGKIRGRKGLLTHIKKLAWEPQRGTQAANVSL